MDRLDRIRPEISTLYKIGGFPVSTRLLIIMLAVIAITIMAIAITEKTFPREEPQEATTTATEVRTDRTQVVAHMDELPKGAWEFYRANFTQQELEKGLDKKLALGQVPTVASESKFESVYNEISGTVSLHCPRQAPKWTVKALRRTSIIPNGRVIYYGGLIPNSNVFKNVEVGAVEFVLMEVSGPRLVLMTSEPVESPVLKRLGGKYAYEVDFSKQNGAKIYDDCAVCDVLDERVIEKTYH